MRPLPYFTLLALVQSVAICQTTETRPAFEAVDTHLSAIGTTRLMRPGTLRGTRYEIKGATMLDMIAKAYGLESDKIFGGPSWLELERFDVLAKVAAKTPPEVLNQMLQTVLQDRFKLMIQKEERPLPAYVLSAGKHQGLKEPDPAAEPGCRLSIQQTGMPQQEPAPGAPVPLISLTIVETCHGLTMSRLADEIRNLPLQTASLRSRPVTDKTGIQGAWDFTFKFSLPRNGGPTPDDISIFDAMDKQLGLKLEQISTSQPVVVVKSVNQTPTPNPPGVEKAFPPLPTEFEVAEIKPSTASTQGPQPIIVNGGLAVPVRVAAGGRGAPMLQNGRVNLQGLTLKNLVTLAWDVTVDDALVGLPKFADTARFDVIAEVPAGPAADAFGDMDAIKPLLRTLLIEKFKITTHQEERPLPGFVLTASKPKLAKADPSNRTKYTEGPGPDGKDPRIGNPALSRLVYCQNMTMAQFARLLPNIGAAYVRNATVLDSTGLEGAWDFTLSFTASPAAMTLGGRGGGEGNAAAEPTGGLSLFDALSKQLGLKLETQKRPMPVVVIDHIEEKPVDN